MNNGVIFEEGGKIRLGIRTGHWPEFARPVLSVQSGNEIVKVASFTNDEGAELFANALIQVCEYAHEMGQKARPRGHWKKLCEDVRGYTVLFECSECGTAARVVIPARECEHEFCPQCGARMDEEGGA